MLLATNGRWPHSKSKKFEFLREHNLYLNVCIIKVIRVAFELLVDWVVISNVELDLVVVHGKGNLIVLDTIVALVVVSLIFISVVEFVVEIVMFFVVAVVYAVVLVVLDVVLDELIDIVVALFADVPDLLFVEIVVSSDVKFFFDDVDFFW